MTQLRQYQLDIIERTRALMKGGCRSILIQSPTGSGKTLLTAHMLGNAAAKNARSWFIVHRRELVKQSSIAFFDQGIRHGICAAGFPEEKDPLVQVASIQTLANRYKTMPPPKLIVWDECHHVAAGSWGKIFHSFPNAFHIGLTATPSRLDGKGLSKWFRAMVEGPPVKELTAQGFLSPYRIFAPPGISVDDVGTRYGDFVQSQLSEIVDKPSITGDAVTHYKKLAHGKRAVVFCVSIRHSEHVAAQFNESGIPALHVDGETSHEDRDRAVRLFAEGRIKVLTNVDLFGEGFDLPAIECAILLRPTQSLALYLQQVGRSLRPSPGKTEALILDHAGNCTRHGFPDDSRAWTLEGREFSKKKNEAVLSIKICDKCFAAQIPGTSACRFCGSPFKVQPRKVEEVEGELEELTPEKLAKLERRRSQGRCRSYEDLVVEGYRREMKNPEGWARHVMEARIKKGAMR